MDPISLETGSIVDDFRLRNRVTRSRWTTIFSAESEHFPGKFAVKVFDLNGSNEKAIGTRDEDIWLNRFQLEGRILDAMSHPGVIPLIKSGFLEDGRPYHVMPFMDANLIYEMGGDIRDPDRLARLAPPRRPRALSMDRAVFLLNQIVETLCLLHAKGIIHRDLKPGNILLTRKKGGDAVLCDFGMARWGNQVFDVPGELIGSKDYVSPEQKLNPASSGAQADVYSLGCIMYRMVTGKLPDNNIGVRFDENAAAPEQMKQLILSCLEENSVNRPENAMVVKTKLQEVTELQV